MAIFDSLDELYDGIGAVFSGIIIGCIEAGELEARKKWQQKRIQVKRTVQEHRENIRKHVDEARESYDFYVLHDMYVSSFKVADSAYKLLKDARTSIRGVKKMLNASYRQKREIKKNKLRPAIKEHNTEIKKEAKKELSLMHEMIRNLSHEKEKLCQQQEDLAQEVTQLNIQTKNLKEYIRDRCGKGGKIWFERSEQRKIERQLSG